MQPTHTAVFAILAVSSDLQADTLQHQRRWAQETAKAHGWTIARTYEGVASGKAGIRSVVSAMMTDIRAAEPQDRPRLVIMVRLDRLGRGDAIAAQILSNSKNLPFSLYVQLAVRCTVCYLIPTMITAKAKTRAQNEVLGRALKAATVRMGLTTTEVAMYLGVSQTRVCKYFSGESSPRASSFLHFMKEAPSLAQELGWTRIDADVVA